MHDSDVDGPISIVMPADCSIQSIGAVHQLVSKIASADGAIRIDCSAVQQVDFTFVQLIASAQMTYADRGIRLMVGAVPGRVRAAFERAGIGLPSPACGATS